MKRCTVILALLCAGVSLNAMQLPQSVIKHIGYFCCIRCSIRAAKDDIDHDRYDQARQELCEARDKLAKYQSHLSNDE